MSSQPCCVNCGMYVMHGDCLCDDCRPRVKDPKAAIAELEAQVEDLSQPGPVATLLARIAALKCCGNCKWFRAEEYQYCGHPEASAAEERNYYDQPYYISAPDKCDFTPSRWAERGTKDG